MKGMKIQASMHHDARCGRSTGSVKKAGLSQPRWRASVAAGPKRYSISDLPIIQLTATGRQHQRQQEDDAEEFARPDLGVEQQRQAEGDRIFDEHGEHVETMLNSAFR